MAKKNIKFSTGFGYYFRFQSKIYPNDPKKNQEKTRQVTKEAFRLLETFTIMLTQKKIMREKIVKICLIKYFH